MIPIARRLLLAATFIVAVTASHPGTALAGEYPVYACEPAVGDVNHSWVPESNTPKMTAYANCPVPWNETRDWNRGLVTIHPISGTDGDDTLGWLNYSALRLRAPAGASLSRMTFTYTFCGESSFKAGVLDDANNWLLSSGPGGCGALLPNQWSTSLGGTPSVRLMTICALTKCNTSGNERAYATMRSATVWVADSSPPAVSITGGSIASDGWHRGTQSLTLGAWDNVGIKRLELFLDEHQDGAVDGSCDWTFVVPCSTPTGAFDVHTPLVSDGRHVVTVKALDSAGNWGWTSHEVLVDNNPPAAPVDLGDVGGEGWRASNDFALRWGNPAQTGTAPIAGANWAICPAGDLDDDTSNCQFGSRDASDLQALDGVRVPAPGDWIARVWLRDAAGNAEPKSARTVHLRWDPAAPDVEILAPNASDPQRITVAASDALSGLARIEVEIQRQGDTAWRSLVVTPQSGTYVARFDDAVLPAGRYSVRAHAVDAAGNERSTDSRGGTRIALTLPVRLHTALSLGGVRNVTGRHGHVRTVLRRTPTAAFGEPVPVRGRLSLPGGNPLAGVDVEIFEQTDLPGEPWRRIGVVRTDGKGRLAYRALTGPSRRLRFVYPGTALIQPQSRVIRLRVRAKTSFGVSRSHVVNGDEVLFRGRVRGQLPRKGKLLQLQAYSRGGWRTFATPRASRRSHRWRYPYRFSATRGLVRYRFRAVVPSEAGFPFIRGASRSLHVTVRGL